MDFEVGREVTVSVVPSCLDVFDFLDGDGPSSRPERGGGW